MTTTQTYLLVGGWLLVIILVAESIRWIRKHYDDEDEK